MTLRFGFRRNNSATENKYIHQSLGSRIIAPIILYENAAIQYASNKKNRTQP
jgi:hypothetical protein